MKLFPRRRLRRRDVQHPEQDVVVEKLETNRDRQTEKATPGRLRA